MMRKKFIIIGLYLISLLFLLYPDYSSTPPPPSSPSQHYITPSHIQMYKSINWYCEKYKVPHYIAYNVAYKESSYRGPNDTTYKHNVSSSAGALGPMQIIPSTASWINKDKTNKSELKNNIKYNVSTSIKLLAYLYKRYKSWDTVAGYYNTGRPIINDYAIYVSTHKNYKDKWVD